MRVLVALWLFRCDRGLHCQPMRSPPTMIRCLAAPDAQAWKVIYGLRIREPRTVTAFGDAFWDAGTRPEGALCNACLRPKDDDGGTMHPGVNEQRMASSLLPSLSLYSFVSSQADSRPSPPSLTRVSLLRRITILR
ncbi:hypothetical protein BDZ89DRAFT_620719 [Hymenopellis radicata]|nr:hypothetical protein BDZ89DRAFT_620719 [Hymenopellis radicata]